MDFVLVTLTNVLLNFQNDLNEPYIPRIGLDGERIRIKKEKDPEKKKKKRKKEGLDGLDPLKPKKVKVITVGLDGEKLKKKKLKLMKPKIKRELDENGMGKSWSRITRLIITEVKKFRTQNQLIGDGLQKQFGFIASLEIDARRCYLAL